MSQESKFVDIQTARQIVEDLYPDAHRIELIEHGYDNIVALVDEQYAVRFPRNQDAAIRNDYERAILEKLDGITSVAVPRLLDIHNDSPSYLITSYIAGRHVSLEAFNAFTSEELTAFGAIIGKFAYELHSSISVAEEQAFRDQAKLGDQFNESWAGYFERMVLNGKFPTAPQQAIAKEYYDRWKIFEEGGRVQVVVHDDLHTDNMLFDGKKLIGVLDFGSASIGTAEQELRQLYRINQTALEAAVKTYEELADRQLDMDAVKIWAIMRELGAYVRRLNAGEIHHPGFLRSCAHLDAWLPEGEWSKQAKLV